MLPSLNLKGHPLLAWQAFWAVSLIVVSLVRIDPWIHAWIATWPAPVLDFFRAITDLGRSHWYLVPTGLGLLLFRWLSARMRGLRARQALRWLSLASGFVFLAVATTGLATAALKYLIGRARPKLLAEEGVFGFQPFGLDADFAGFPSGHANTAVALAICLVFLWPRRWPLFVGFAAVVASSRIVVGAHYPSDVVAGAYLAILMTFAWRHAFAKRRLLFAWTREGRVVVRGRRIRAWMSEKVKDWLRRLGVARGAMAPRPLAGCGARAIPPLLLVGPSGSDTIYGTGTAVRAQPEGCDVNGPRQPRPAARWRGPDVGPGA